MMGHNKGDASVFLFDEDAQERLDEIVLEIANSPELYDEVYEKHRDFIHSVLEVAREGDIDAQYRVASLMHYSKANTQESVEWMKKTANSMYPEAIFIVAQHYAKGDFGYEYNPSEASRLFDILIHSEDLEAKAKAEQYLQNNPTVQQKLIEYQRTNQSGIMKIRSVSDYFKLTNKDNLLCIQDVELISLKSHIFDALLYENKDEKDNIVLKLRNLPEDEKSKFIAALITNNTVIILKLFENILSTDVFARYQRQLAKITEHDEKNFFSDSGWLNDAVKHIILEMLQADDNNMLSLPDRERILSAAMHSISDEEINLQSKGYLLHEIDIELMSDEFSNIEYVESIKALKQNRFQGDIYPKELIAALKYNKVDFSEFIMLLTGFLQQVAGDENEAKEILRQIRLSYTVIDYHDSYDRIQILLTHCAEKIDKDVMSVVSSAYSNLKETNLAFNHSRRFFENRLAQLCYGLISYPGVEKVARQFVNINVRSQSDLEKAIFSMSSLNNSQALDLMQSLIVKSSHMPKKLSQRKAGFFSRESELKGTLSESVYSKNAGLLKSISPNFFDELTEKNLRNKLVDVRIIDDYATFRQHHVSVGSVSGHAFFIVALLDQYMDKSKDDPELSANVSSFLDAFITGFINRGFHSLIEVMDVLDEQHIKNIFKKYNVKLDLKIVGDAILIEQAFRDCQEYTKNLCLKKSMQQELLSTPRAKRIRLHDLLRDSILQLMYYARYPENFDGFAKFADVAKEIGNSSVESLLRLAVFEQERVIATEQLLDIAHQEGVSLDYGIMHALHVAASLNNISVIKKLLSQGIDLHIKDAVGNTALVYAVTHGSMDITRIFVKHDIHSLEQKINRLEETLFLAAARIGYWNLINELRLFVLDQSALEASMLNAKDLRGITLSHYIAANGREDLLDLLIAKEVDLNSVDSQGNTPVIWAALCGQWDFVERMLLEKKIDPYYKNKASQSVYDFALQQGKMNIIKLIEARKTPPSTIFSQPGVAVRNDNIVAKESKPQVKNR